MSGGKVVIGTVKGDLTNSVKPCQHDAEGRFSGYRSCTDASPEKLSMPSPHNPQLIGFGQADHHHAQQAPLITALETAGLWQKVRSW